MAKTSKDMRAIKDRAPYREAEARLARLKPALEAAALRLGKVTMRINRIEKLKQYLNRCVTIMPAMSEMELDKITQQVAADGEIPEALMKRLRAEAPRVPFTEPDNLAEMNEVNDASRSVELFKRAIQLQDREVLRQRNLALAEVYDGVRDTRERIARKIAGRRSRPGRGDPRGTRFYRRAEVAGRGR